MKPVSGPKSAARRIGSWLVVVLVANCLSLAVPTPTADAAVQSSYRWFNDNGPQAGNTAAAAENTALSSAPKYSIRRLRFGVKNSGTESELLRKASLALNSGEDYSTSFVIDASAGFAYIGTLTSPGKVVKINLSNFTRVGVLTLDSGENSLTSAIIDTTAGFAYFGTNTSPGKVVKVSLSSFTRIGAVTLDTGESFLESAVLDDTGGTHYGYFGTQTTPGRVVKVNLATFARDSALTLGSGEDSLRIAIIDTLFGFAYFGTSTSPGKIVKINLTTFATSTTLTLNSGEDSLRSAIIDSSTTTAYFGTDTSPGKIVRVNLSDFTRDSAITLTSGENRLISATADITNRSAFFGTYTAAGRVVKINLATFARDSAITLNSGEDNLRSAVIDTAKGYAYFGTDTTPSQVIKVSIAPRASFRLEYGAKTSTCGAIASWTQVPVSVASEHWQMENSANLTDGAATTDFSQLSNPGGFTFKAGQVKDTSSETTEISLGEKQFTELEYSIIPVVYATASGNYCFRLTDAGVATNFTYGQYAEATVTPAVTSTTVDILKASGFANTYDQRGEYKPLCFNRASCEIVQPITADSSTSLTTVAVLLGKVGSPTDSVTIDLCAYGGTGDGCQSVLRTWTIEAGSMTGSDWEYMTVSPSLPVTNGAVYVLRFQRTGNFNYSNHFWIGSNFKRYEPSGSTNLYYYYGAARLDGADLKDALFYGS